MRGAEGQTVSEAGTPFPDFTPEPGFSFPWGVGYLSPWHPTDGKLLATLPAFGHGASPNHQCGWCSLWSVRMLVSVLNPIMSFPSAVPLELKKLLYESNYKK